MSAENAWRIAMGAAAEPAYGMATDWWDRAGDYAGADIKRLSERIAALPMPPAFRAEVEAETRAIKELSLSFFVEQATAVADELLAAGLINSTVRSIRIEEARIMAAEALSRLEAKGEREDV